MFQNESKDLLVIELNDRYQADYDYNGELDVDVDPADAYTYKTLKAVRCG